MVERDQRDTQWSRCCFGSGKRRFGPFLGNTAAGIAREKVGIARRDKPFVSGREGFPRVGEIVRNTVQGDDIRGHFVRTIEPAELP